MPRQTARATMLNPPADTRRPQGSKKMVDRYTKTMLTIIAAALVCLAVQGVVPSAKAARDTCGELLNPCYVTNDNARPLTVTRAE